MNTNLQHTANADYFKRGIFVISVIISLLAVFSQYFFEILSSLIVLNIIIHWFWEPQKPLIVMFGYIFSWLAISIGFFYVWIFDAEFTDLLSRPFYSKDNIITAYWLSITGLLFTALGTKIFYEQTKNKIIDPNIVKTYNPQKIIILYLGFYFAVSFLKNFIRATIPGLFQFFVFLYFLKWGIFFIMFLTIWTHNKYRTVFWIIVATEFILGFTSYFSQFKEIMIFTSIVYLSLFTFNKKNFLYGTLIAVFIVLVGIFWSYVKPTYRQFLSGGERRQVVKVSKTEALKKIVSYIPQFDIERMKIGTEVMVARIFFLEYFSATIRFIPLYKPYFGGKNYTDAIKHILMPRILFPNKKAIDDSKHTFELTGIQVATAKQGTSISVGYTAEAYADFGPFWMFIPLFLLGLTWGLIYKTLITNAPTTIWGYAVIFPQFYQYSAYGKNIIKLLGDTFWFFIVAFIFIKFLAPIFEKFIKNE